MNTFMKSSLDTYFGDIQAKMEVYDVVRELVDDVELWDTENNLGKARKNLALSQKLNDAVLGRMKQLQDRNERLTAQLAKFKQGAVQTRETFVKDIGFFLAENKQVQKLKDKIVELETRLHNYAVHGTDSMETIEAEQAQAAEPATDEAAAQQPGPAIENSIDENAPLSTLVNLPKAATATTTPEQQMFLYDLDDEFLLNVFSYLDTPEVLNVAAMCKYSFKRVVTLFGIDSVVAQPEWSLRPDRNALLADAAGTTTAGAAGSAGTGTGTGTTGSVKVTPATPDRSGVSKGTDKTPDKKAPASLPPPPATATASAATAPPAVPAPAMAGTQGLAEPGLTKEIVDVLIKKLTPAELMVIMSIAEKLKKLTAEKEDLTARLESTESVRNFLIEKLKAAEMEIRNLMTSSAALKKQSVSDQEIIGYLDLRVGELESQRADFAMRCQQLQASLDLQFGSHSHREQQLSTELSEYKLKYETLDVNFKTQKKLLIKEVKSLRAQVEALTNERNLQANQFRMLREALNLGAGAGGSVGGGGSGGISGGAAVGSGSGSGGVGGGARSGYQK